MPGRRSPPMPPSVSPQWASRALTSVPSWLSGCRVHHQPSGLVEHDQIGILVQDRERDALGSGRGGQGRWQVEDISGTWTDLFGRFLEHRAVAPDLPLFDQRLDAGTRDRADGIGKEPIDPLSSRRRRPRPW